LKVAESLFEFTSELWLHAGDAGWHFVTLPVEVADDVDELAGERSGFGSIPVKATIGASAWKTSLFPDKQAGSFVLPVKQAIRRQEGLEVGVPVLVKLILDRDRAQP